MCSSDLWQLHEVYSDETTKDWVVKGCTTAGIGCIECKQPVIDAIVKEQEPMHERAQQYLDDPSLVRAIVADGCEAARKLAQETMRDVREAMGLGSLNAAPAPVASPVAMLRDVIELVDDMERPEAVILGCQPEGRRLRPRRKSLGRRVPPRILSVVPPPRAAEGGAPARRRPSPAWPAAAGRTTCRSASRSCRG